MSYQTITATVAGYRSNANWPTSWWNDTGLDINEGDELVFDATNPSGAVLPWPGHPGFSPEGDLSIPDWEYSLSRVEGTEDSNPINFMALVGKIGEDGPVFRVGSSLTKTANRTGRLYLACNDGVSFEDNSGSWDVVVTVQPSCPGGGCWDEDAGKCAYNYSGVDAKTYASIEDYKGTYNPNPNFCVYRYPDSSVNPCGAPSDATDCANFVSQALLYGGLPLTDDWYAENRIDTPKWTGAEDTTQLPSYLRNLVSGAPGEDSVDIRPPGEVWVNGLDTGRTISNLQLIISHGSVDMTARENIITACEALWAEGIRIGDILYAITNGLEHVALVVAWGPYVTTWNEIYNMNTAALPTQRNSSNPVPYVIDHGSHVLYADPKPQVWAAGPKPYYALRWLPPQETSPGDFGERTGFNSAAQPPWGFIHIPSVVLFAPEQVREPWFDDKSEILA